MTTEINERLRSSLAGWGDNIMFLLKVLTIDFGVNRGVNVTE